MSISAWVGIILAISDPGNSSSAAATSATQEPQAAQTDADGDGLPDELEQQLAERYAPVVLIDSREPNLPEDVRSFFKQTSLWLFDDSCRDRRKEVLSRVADPIPLQSTTSCNGGIHVTSAASRSTKKLETYYLSDVAVPARAGSRDTSRWNTYFHAFSNGLGGITIQYWRFYAYNTSYLGGIRVPVGNHGGDWEAIHVILGPGPQYSPKQIRLLGHKDISEFGWDKTVSQGTHVIIRSGKGGHTSELANREDAARQDHFIVQESWTGGKVTWAHKKKESTPSGVLVNLGEKTRPMAGMEFLSYSGLWGTRKSGWFGFVNSGYWGPAFNETSMMRENGFISAWCEGIADPQKQRDIPGIGVVRECYPTHTVP